MTPKTGDDNELVELLTDYEDAQMAHARHLEAKQDPTLLKSLADLRTALEVDGLLDE